MGKKSTYIKAKRQQQQFYLQPFVLVRVHQQNRFNQEKNTIKDLLSSRTIATCRILHSRMKNGYRCVRNRRILWKVHSLELLQCRVQFHARKLKICAGRLKELEMNVQKLWQRREFFLRGKEKPSFFFPFFIPSSLRACSLGGSSLSTAQAKSWSSTDILRAVLS